MDHNTKNISTYCTTGLAAILAALLLSGCAYYLERHVNTVAEFNKIDRSSRFLKVHLLDGSVELFDKWEIDDTARVVRGEGERRDFDRLRVKLGRDTIPFEHIALFETNDTVTSGATAAMTIVTLGSAALSSYCISNPKSCFGSCPTFYAWNGERMELQAEGFSSSVLPSLEDSDIDELYSAKPAGQRFDLRLTNEAMETHIIRYADILAIQRPANGRIINSPDERFYSATSITPPSRCIAPEGECTGLLNSYDTKERFSYADSRNLAERETVDVQFPSVPPGKHGLVIGFRQTLLPTYIFYQALAYLGNSVGYWMAECERNSASMKSSFESIGQKLGGIEVFVQGPDHQWIKAGEVNETGPIATNVQIVPLPDNGMPTAVKLRMSKGVWRINYLALSAITEAPLPIRIKPDEIYRGITKDDETLAKFTNRTKPLITLPGDEYTLSYQLPADYAQYDLFLESRGYYLEWMREQWYADENPVKAIKMFREPDAYLKEEAAHFKSLEPQMEDAFWRSRYVHHEN
jgi:hypothetical protein